MTDHWQVLAALLHKLGSETIPGAKINESDRALALETLQSACLKYAAFDGFLSGAGAVIETTGPSLSIQEWAAHEMSLRNAKNKGWAEVMVKVADILSICGRKRKRRPSGSKLSEDQDVWLAFGAWGLTRHKHLSATQAIKAAMDAVRAGGSEIKGNSDDAIIRRIRTTLKEYEPTFECMILEENSERI